MKESAETTDRQEAERFFARGSTPRDDGRLPIVLSGKNLTFSELADWFLERRSKPPFRSENTHPQNLNALKLLVPAFGDILLSDITPRRSRNTCGEAECPQKNTNQSSEFATRGQG